MRLFFVALFHVCLIAFCSAQQSVTIFYDSAWLITREADAVFKRTAVVDFSGDSLIFNGPFKDVAMDGTIRAEGQYMKGKKEGEFSFYHPNGVLEVKGTYADDRQIGTWKYYNEFGGDKQTIEINGEDFIVQEFYNEKDKLLVQNGTGNWKLFAPLGNQYALLDAYFDNGKRVDTWNFRYYQGSRIFREEYDENGNFLEGIDYRGRGKSTYTKTQFTSSLFEIPSIKKMEKLLADEHFYGADAIQYIKGIPPVAVTHDGLKPTYKGGIEAFYNYVLQNYRYPEEAYQQKLEGQVIVNFHLSAEGYPSDFRILRGISQALNAEAVRLIKNAPGWQQATYNNQPVSSRMTIPINFRVGN